jgi:hypothetical protein
MEGEKMIVLGEVELISRYCLRIQLERLRRTKES